MRKLILLPFLFLAACAKAPEGEKADNPATRKAEDLRKSVGAAERAAEKAGVAIGERETRVPEE